MPTLIGPSAIFAQAKTRTVRSGTVIVGGLAARAGTDAAGAAAGIAAAAKRQAFRQLFWFFRLELLWSGSAPWKALLSTTRGNKSFLGTSGKLVPNVIVLLPSC